MSFCAPAVKALVVVVLLNWGVPGFDGGPSSIVAV